jgi:hypothetical protein
MDAEKLPEVTPQVCGYPGLPLHLRARRRPALPFSLPSALEIIDLMLSVPGAAQPRDIDALLDFRFLLRHRADAESALKIFCELRRSLEQVHYLAFYRLRRCLETNIRAEVIPSCGALPVEISLRLDHFCVEAIRRQCLCRAFNGMAVSAKPVLRFAFVV